MYWSFVLSLAIGGFLVERRADARAQGVEMLAKGGIGFGALDGVRAQTMDRGAGQVQPAAERFRTERRVQKLKCQASGVPLRRHQGARLARARERFRGEAVRLGNDAEHARELVAERLEELIRGGNELACELGARGGQRF